MRPAMISFTGADDKTPIESLQRLACEFPDIEFAILFSMTRAGTARYPSAKWIERVQQSGLRLAAHFCGRVAEDVVQTGRTLLDAHLRGFSRIQINTSNPVDIDRLLDWSARVAGHSGHPVEPILQCRGDFPEDDRISWLYDRSGGNGDQPREWPSKPKLGSVRYGYAGGIGPDSVATILRKLPETGTFWIDMESRIRDERNEFSIEMCRKVCELTWTESV